MARRIFSVLVDQVVGIIDDVFLAVMTWILDNR
jgi:hypothetical protein